MTENVDSLALGPGHRFPLAKYGAITAALSREFPRAMMFGAPASWSDIAEVHDAAYVAAVRAGALDAGALRRLGLPWSQQLVLRSRRSVGGTLAALAWAMQTGAAGHVAGGTHHAFRGRGEGFCTFNDIAVGIAVARRDHGVRRIAVVDLDVHQGNGTAAIFAHDADVFTLSLHGAHNYPFAKETSTLDVGLPDGCDDATYLRALDESLEKVASFRPELVIYQAGVDALEGDRLGRMSLTHAGLRSRDARVYAAARGWCAPLVVTLGGGYGSDLRATVEAHVNVYRGLMAAFD
jgi:acetoin utilization deacetylase AcuC-like enzyme